MGIMSFGCDLSLLTGGLPKAKNGKNSAHFHQSGIRNTLQLYWFQRCCAEDGHSPGLGNTPSRRRLRGFQIILVGATAVAGPWRDGNG